MKLLAKFFLNQTDSLFDISIEYIAIIYVASALLFFFLCLLSYSIGGFSISEIGLIIAWIPFSFIVITFFFYLDLNEYQTIPTIHLVTLITGSIANITAFIGLLIPFTRINETNKQLHNSMQEGLGENYMDVINPSLYKKIYREVRFKWIQYFLWSSQRRLFKKTVHTHKNLPYKILENGTLRLNVYHPTKKGTYPVIIFIHGGAWLLGHKDRLRDDRTCVLLANFGYVVYNINYRLMFNKAKALNDMLSDVREAIKFAKQNAVAFYGDPNHVFLFGRSAGAHLALLTAFTQKGPFFEEEIGKYSEESLEVAGVIAFYPPTDLKRLYESMNFFPGRTAMDIIIGKPEEKLNQYQLFSPLQYITESHAKNIPPVFMAQGLRDRIVNPEQSKKLHLKLNQYDVTNVLLELPTANHAFDRVLRGPSGQLVYKYLSQFLAWVLSKRKEKKSEED